MTNQNKKKVPARQRPIALNFRQREVLDEQKARYDKDSGTTSNWGGFLGTIALLGLAAAGLYLLVEATKRSQQAADVKCPKCHNDFLVALASTSPRAFYTPCPHCSSELVVDLGK